MHRYQGKGLHGEVVEALGARIAGGHISAGELLNLTELEREFGVSKTVMREALKVLTAKGLVQAKQRFGTYVTEREHWQLLDPTVLAWEMSGRNPSNMLAMLGEARSTIEPRAAELAAERREESDIAAMDEALNAMASPDRLQAIDGDISFHRAVFTASHNDLLERFGLLIESLLGARGHLVHDTATPAVALSVHRELRDAIAAGDASLAHTTAAGLISRARGDEGLALQEGGTPV